MHAFGNPAVDGFTSTPPRRWIAVLLTLLAPGLGHLYAGRLGRAISVLVLALIAAPALMMLFVAGRGAIWTSLATLAGALVFWILVVRDAARCARTGRALRAPRARRILPYLVFVIVAGGCLETERWSLRKHWRAFRVPTGSMQPALLPGDHVMADMRAFEDQQPKPGEVVVLEVPERGGALYFKRILAGPGTVVATSIQSPGQVLVDGEPIPGLRSERHLSTRLREDEYFLVGDNFDNSIDSRQFGPVARDHILGRACFIYFSRDPEGGVRWDRPGLVFDHVEGIRQGLPPSADRS